MIRVGVVDSGGPEQAIGEGRAFLADGSTSPQTPDALGHGTAVAGIISRACPAAHIIHAQVFHDRPLTSAVRVAAALRWLAGLPDPPRLICLSLGLREDRAALRTAVQSILRPGLLLVAAHPAQGAPCFPAAYPGVIAATGDARCGWDQISALGPALFGAWCDSPEHRPGGIGGASLGAARLAGHLAAMLAAGEMVDDVAAATGLLTRRASFHGAERRG
ncbi:MAG: S8 family serine peptidase [Paracoccus sp. (in: a-proteobacteria)]|uniref:subtilisin-like serine protease QhpE n=1 Tax=Paracoccus sp. TaxID=267 RepID=UPI0026E07A8F|nr:S8 family serine peptidase [Paracoccus sp. (in: a-proteobacteria)]MDO5620014.1 S8 family serine peptidase [Paracoccus sp. (in: a-proteobacteria)]